MRAREAKAELAKLPLTEAGHRQGKALIDAIHRAGDRVATVRVTKGGHGTVRIDTVSGQVFAGIKAELPDGS